MLWLKAALLAGAELADVDTINARVLSFAGCVFFLRCQACVANVLNEVVWVMLALYISIVQDCKLTWYGLAVVEGIFSFGTTVLATE